MKKILFVASLYYPHVGGIETIITELAENYRRMGIDSVILTKRWPVDLVVRDEYQKIPIYRVTSAKTNAEFFDTLNEIKKIQSDLKADIIHVIGARRPLPLFALILSRVWNVPVVITIAGSEIPHKDDKTTQDIWQSGIEIIPGTVRQSDAVTVLSKDLGTALEKVLPNCKYKLLYAGLDLSIFTKAKAKKAKKPYILSLRRLVRSKGVDILIRAFSVITQKFPELKLYIAGEGEEKESLATLIQSLGLEEKVEFLGNVDINKAASLLKNAEMTVVPSRSEGGGLVNIEAQACGCPVIASNIGGIPEYIQKDETGLLFDSEDYHELAIFIEKLFNDKKLKNKLIANGKNFAKKFSWDYLINDYIKLYQKTILSCKNKDFMPWSSLTKKLWQGVIMEQTAYRIIRQYNVSDGARLELLRETEYNAVFLLHGSGKKILRISKKILLNDINFELEAISYLKKRNIPVASWIPNKNGEAITVVKNSYGVMFEYVDGRHIQIDKDNYPSLQEALRAGVLLGNMHNVSRNFQTTTTRTRTIFSEFENLIKHKQKFINYYIDGGIFIEEVLKNIDFAKTSTGAQGLIHNDFRSHNVFFADNQIKAVIDFDWSCQGPLEKDLALGIVEWSFPDGQEAANEEIFDNFLKGYNSTQQVKVKRDKKLYRWAMFSCLSDAATYLYNRIDNNKIKQPIRSYMYKKYNYYKNKLKE